MIQLTEGRWRSDVNIEVAMDLFAVGFQDSRTPVGSRFLLPHLHIDVEGGPRSSDVVKSSAPENRRRSLQEDLLAWLERNLSPGPGRHAGPFCVFPGEVLGEVGEHSSALWRTVAGIVFPFEIGTLIQDRDSQGFTRGRMNPCLSNLPGQGTAGLSGPHDGHIKRFCRPEPVPPEVTMNSLQRRFGKCYV